MWLFVYPDAGEIDLARNIHLDLNVILPEEEELAAVWPHTQGENRDAVMQPSSFRNFPVEHVRATWPLELIAGNLSSQLGRDGQDLSIRGQLPVRFLVTALSGAILTLGLGVTGAMTAGDGRADVYICFRLSKVGTVRITNRRGSTRQWEPVVRRAEPSWAFISGFSPRPPWSVGAVVSVAAASAPRYPHMQLHQPGRKIDLIDMGLLSSVFTGVVPVGVDVPAAAVIKKRIAWKQPHVTSSSWAAPQGGPSRSGMVASAVTRLAAPKVPMTWEPKNQQEHEDLRLSELDPAVADHNEVGDYAASGVSMMDLANHQHVGHPVHPVKNCLGQKASGPGMGSGGRGLRGIPVVDRACRTNQWIERDCIRWESLEFRGDPIVDDRAMHASERAS